jgi:hypothetical protein
MLYLDVIKKRNTMANTNNYGLSQETLESALKNMIAEGYMDPTDTTDDLISYTRSMVENIPFMVTRKITQWSVSNC